MQAIEPLIVPSQVFVFYVNRALVIWYSKKQNTVETSTFGSEFVAMRIATEITEGLQY
jgi:hypothetical protein